MASSSHQPLFPNGQLNGKADAFRHAYWNALNRRDCSEKDGNGVLKIKLFGDAHESETPPQLSLESQMDLFNNAVGVSVTDNAYSQFASDDAIANIIITKLNNGELRYLSPIEPTPTSGSNGINNDFWHINGDKNLAKHGITTATQLKPTNQ